MEFQVLAFEEEPSEDYLDSYGNHPEDILFECDGGIFPSILDIFSEEGPGQVSQSTNWDECLDYMISEMMIKNPRFGLYVVEDVELHYSRDSYTGEGDVDMYCSDPRPARWHEMRMAYSFWDCVKRFPEQLKLHWLHAQGISL